MKKWNCSIYCVPVRLELDNKGFWVDYRKSEANEKFDSVLDRLSRVKNIGRLLDSLIDKDILTVL